jgi:RNA recognition motif-containing protein
MKNIYVGNMEGGVTEQMIRSSFETYGTVERVTIVANEAGQPKGFGFVEMADDAAAAKAIAAMNGMELNGKRLRVSEGRSQGALGTGRRPSE